MDLRLLALVLVWPLSVMAADGGVMDVVLLPRYQLPSEILTQNNWANTLQGNQECTWWSGGSELLQRLKAARAEPSLSAANVGETLHRCVGKIEDTGLTRPKECKFYLCGGMRIGDNIAVVLGLDWEEGRNATSGTAVFVFTPQGTLIDAARLGGFPEGNSVTGKLKNDGTLIRGWWDGFARPTQPALERRITPSGVICPRAIAAPTAATPSANSRLYRDPKSGETLAVTRDACDVLAVSYLAKPKKPWQPMRINDTPDAGPVSAGFKGSTDVYLLEISDQSVSCTNPDTKVQTFERVAP